MAEALGCEEVATGASSPETAGTSEDDVLAVEGLTCRFGGTLALDDVHLRLRRGEVVALLGENGAGKSTLIKILAGVHQPTAGTIRLGDDVFPHGISAAEARAHGLAFVHQDLGLLNSLSVAENIAHVTGFSRRHGLIAWKRQRELAHELLRRWEIDIDPATPVAELAAAQRALVAVARALATDARAIVFDEPTASLPRHDVELLYGAVERLRAGGVGVLYVTHRLGEVFEIADRVTILRDGRRVATRPTAELSHDSLVELIIGRSLEAFYPEPPEVRDDIVLDVSGIAGDEVAEASLQVHRGEIVGVTGLLGSGYETLLSLIFGGRIPSGGTVAVGEAPVRTGSPPASIAAGLAFAPADRKRLGSILTWTLRENLTLPRIRSWGPSQWLSAKRERKESLPWLRQLDVVPPEPERLFSSLSGGNQQKVVLARWLRCGAKAYLLEEPTNGVDMGAKHAIYTALTEVAGEGAAVLFSSSDSEELCSVCDRVIVMRDGRIGAVLDGATLTVDKLLAETIHAKANGSQPAEAHHV